MGSPGRLSSELPPTRTNPGPQKISTMPVFASARLTIQRRVKAVMRTARPLTTGSPLANNSVAATQVASAKMMMVRVLMALSPI